MSWLTKMTPVRRASPGLERRLWRKLPLIWIAGTAAPLIVLAFLHSLSGPQDGMDTVRWLQKLDYIVGGLVLFHWTMVLTVGIGCVIVMVMKGPGYVADGYPVSHSDRPRKSSESIRQTIS